MIAISFLFTVDCNADVDWKKGRIQPMEEYSEGDAREWTEIAEDHIPRVRRSIDRGEEAILIEVKLKTSPSHYIEKFGVMDLDKKEIKAISIERSNIPLNYAYVLVSEILYRGKFKFFAKCNLHDLWVSEIHLDDIE
jgi:desulfoferrodoxin (superoxide reductase-like protein)